MTTLARLVPVVVALIAIPTVAAAAPTERRLHSNAVEASTFLWNDWNKFEENYHPNYVADDDPRTAWVEGDPGSGAGQWLRINVTPLDHTSKIRLRIRNGYQKSKTLFAANARAKDVVVRLLPSGAETKATLVDKDGWQELTVEQPSAIVKAVELRIGSVYEGSKYADLCISDVQVFATSDTKDNPAFEKDKRKQLLAWRAARLAAAKMFEGRKVALPLYPSYAVSSAETEIDCGECDPVVGNLIATAAKDKAFAEWKDALAIAATALKDLDTLQLAQIGRVSATKLPVVDGFERPTLDEAAGGEGPWFDDKALRLPFAPSSSYLFADQLKVLDRKGTLTPSAFEHGDQKCKGDVTWVSRAKSTAGPDQVRVLVIGRCGKVEGREGYYDGAALQMLVYGTDGKLLITAGFGYLDAYRWGGDGDQPMIIGGHGILQQGATIDVKPIAK